MKIKVLLFFLFLFCFVGFATLNAAGTKTLVITEAMADPLGSDSQYEWVEVTNYSSLDINLKDWKFNNKPLPDTVISPKEIFIIAKNQEGFITRYQSHSRIIQLDISLANSGGTLTLEHSSSGEANVFVYPAAKEDYSYELLEGECNQVKLHPLNNSAGRINTPCINVTTSPSVTLPPAGEYSSKIFIYKAMPYPASGEEWVELKNIDNITVNLKNWILEDASNKKYTLPDLLINPGASVKVYPSGISLNNTGDTLTLTNPVSEQVDVFFYESSRKGDILSIGSESILENEGESKQYTSTTTTSAPICITENNDYSKQLEQPKIYR